MIRKIWSGAFTLAAVLGIAAASAAPASAGLMFNHCEPLNHR